MYVDALMDLSGTTMVPVLNVVLASVCDMLTPNGSIWNNNGSCSKCCSYYDFVMLVGYFITW